MKHERSVFIDREDECGLSSSTSKPSKMESLNQSVMLVGSPESVTPVMGPVKVSVTSVIEF